MKDQTKRRFTPLIAFCFFGHEKLAKFLIEQGADLTLKYQSGQTPFDSCCQGGKRRHCRSLSPDQRTSSKMESVSPEALIFTCKNNQIDIVDRLLNSGFKINTISSKGSTALIETIKLGLDPIFDRLVMDGADLNLP